MAVRGVRGAITVSENTSEAILEATEELLRWLIQQNDIHEEAVASILFTSTPDLNAAFPAKAARNMGWRHVALMGFQEIDVPEGLKMCIRVLIHWNTDKNNRELIHAFLRGASALRPDLVQATNDADSQK